MCRQSTVDSQHTIEKNNRTKNSNGMNVNGKKEERVKETA